jgi:serine/threonine protein kinase
MQLEQLGPYQIGRKLGRGGMGVVYEGVDVETGQKAAVKVLSAGLSDEQDFRTRFESEIETLRRLNHPNIVRLFGFGQQQGQLFYAMEMVDGNSLESELRRGRRFDWREATRIGMQVCRGLRHAHDRGVIHRDIKPGNLLEAPDGAIKLSDFGIARLFGRARLTSAGAVVGTVEYMAPEQAEARPVDHRVDLYSLGGVLYAILAQRPPLRAMSVAEMIQKLQTLQPEPVRTYAADVPEELERIITELLEKSPERRLPNATVLLRRLEAMLEVLAPGLDPDGEPAGKGGFDLNVRTASAGDWLPGGLPPTRALDDESHPRPELEILPSVSASRLPETAPVTANRPAERPPREAAAAERQEAESGPEPGTHFTPVAPDDLDAPPGGEDHAAWISPQTWMLAVGLLAVGVGVWYLLQPPTVDGLYDKIMAETRDGTNQSLRDAERDIDDFLSRCPPKDPRAEQMREMAWEIDLDRRERRFELQASGRISGQAQLSPCERAYLEAINYVRLDPELGMARLQALIDLYEHGTDRAGTTGQCLELARRRLERLRREVDQRVPGQRAAIADRLDLAERLAETDPESARAMRQAVVELYGDRPWAAEGVARARAALAEQEKADQEKAELPSGEKTPEP